MKQKLLFRQIIVLSLVTMILLSLAACGKYPSKTVDPITAEQAITQLKEQAESLGFDNALSELEEKSTTQIGSDSYIRLQQQYNGIPVYGKTIVCVANEQGELTSVSGNVVDINPDINLDPTVTMDAVESTIRAYTSDTLGREDALSAAIEITLDQQYIFDGSKLANMYDVRFGGNILDSHKVLVDANSAKVLSWESVFSDFVTNSEMLEDANISCDENTDHKLALMDQQRNITIFAVDQETVDRLQTIENIAADTSLIVTVDPDGEASEGVDALVHIAQIHDFYANVLNRQGYDGKNSPVYVYLCSEDMLTDNAKGNAFPDYGTLFIGTAKDVFTEPISKALDIIAHEYTHMVFKMEAGDTQDIHSDSVNEAIADIFGNVIELYVNGEQDASWPLAENAGYIKYNMADSVTMASYGESAHDNARILSHSAYLMWNGIDGANSKRLSTAELAELWYRAILMMPSDCDFILCRQLVEVAAQSMETLDDEQRACVREAFNRVGIPSTREDTFYADYRLNENATLTVYDQNNEPYSGYTLRINGTIDMSEIASNMTPDIGWVVNRTNTVEEAGAYALDLPQGCYTLTITDPHYDESYTIYVEISDEYAETNIDLITAYEEPLVVVIPELDYENLVTDAYQDAFADDDGFEYCYHIPQFNLRGNWAQQINKTIYDQCYAILDRDVYDCMDEYGYPDIADMIYCWGYHGEYASVVIETNATMYADTEYSVFTISTSDGKEVSMDELLSSYGMDQDTFHALVRDCLKQYWEEKSDIRDNVGSDFFDDRVAKTLADSNVRNVIPFINPNGELSFVANIYSLAAGDSYLHLINADGTLEMGYLECSKDHSADGAEPTGDVLQYFIEYCDQLYFTEDDIRDFDDEMCMYARNAIFAKSGRKFQSQQLQDYFGKYSWYEPAVETDSFSEDMLNRKQLENLALIQAREEALEIESLVASLDGEAGIYTRYLHSGGYDELLGREYDKTALEVSSCLADLDNDGTNELFLSLGTGQSGIRGKETYTFLLDIESNQVFTVAETYFGGGSMGGDNLAIKFDSVTQTHVLVLEGHIRDGVEAYDSYMDVYTKPNFKVGMELNESYYSQYNNWYKENVDKVRSETTLYYEDGYDFRFYQIDGQYVAEETFNAAWARFEAPRDGFKLKAGTYANPVP